MSTKLAGFERFIFFILGVALLALGVFGVTLWLDIPEANDLADQINLTAVEGVEQHTGYEVALWVTAILGVLLGLWFLIANLRRRSFNKVPSDASNEDGTIDLSISQIASAVSSWIEKYPRVESVSHKVAMDRKRPTVTWRVDAQPTADVAGLKQYLEETETDFRHAVQNVDVDTRFLIHFDKVS